MISVALIGRLTADPTAHTGEKHESATFRLAVPRTVGDSADFVDIVCFDKLAATCAEHLSDRDVAVVGKLRLSEWSGRDGERSSKVQVSRSRPVHRRAKEQRAGADVGRRRELFVVVGQVPVTVAGFE